MAEQENAGSLTGALKLDLSEWMPNVEAAIREGAELSAQLDGRIAEAGKAASASIGDVGQQLSALVTQSSQATAAANATASELQQMSATSRSTEQAVRGLAVDATAARSSLNQLALEAVEQTQVQRSMSVAVTNASVDLKQMAAAIELATREAREQTLVLKSMASAMTDVGNRGRAASSGVKEVGAASDDVLTRMKGAFGAESPLGKFAGMLKGAGVIAAIGMIAQTTEQVTERTRELNQQWAEGKIGPEEFAAGLLQSVPILGSIYDSMYNIGDLITGASADLAAANAEMKRSDEFMARWNASAKATAAEIEKINRELARAQLQNALNAIDTGTGTDEEKAQRKAELQGRFDQQERAAQTAATVGSIEQRARDDRAKLHEQVREKQRQLAEAEKFDEFEGWGFGPSMDEQKANVDRIKGEIDLLEAQKNAITNKAKQDVAALTAKAAQLDQAKAQSATSSTAPSTRADGAAATPPSTTPPNGPDNSRATSSTSPRSRGNDPAAAAELATYNAQRAVLLAEGKKLEAEILANHREFTNKLRAAQSQQEYDAIIRQQAAEEQMIRQRYRDAEIAAAKKAADEKVRIAEREARDVERASKADRSTSAPPAVDLATPDEALQNARQRVRNAQTSGERTLAQIDVRDAMGLSLTATQRAQRQRLIDMGVGEDTRVAVGSARSAGPELAAASERIVRGPLRPNQDDQDQQRRTMEYRPDRDGRGGEIQLMDNRPGRDRQGTGGGQQRTGEPVSVDTRIERIELKVDEPKLAQLVAGHLTSSMPPLVDAVVDRKLAGMKMQQIASQVGGTL